MDLIQRARKLFAIASSPCRATDKRVEFSFAERNFSLYRQPVVRVLFDKRHENFVRKLAWLAEF